MNIFYGVCGEGKGHAGRSITLIDELSKHHNVYIFASGEAYELFKICGFSPIKIEGFKFKINSSGKVNLIASFKHLVNFLFNMESDIKRIENFAKNTKPDFCITDFDAIIPRVAKRLKVPCVSIDNQHKFLMRIKGLPLRLQAYCFLAGLLIRFLIPNISRCIITTFHNCDSLDKKKYFHAPIMIRKEILNLNKSNDGHVLVYLKDYLKNDFSRAIEPINDCKFKVYGSGWDTNNPNIEFKNTSNNEFAKDLSSSKAIICCAGNQLVGEAKYFGKKILAIPIPAQDEQYVNAFYVQNDNLGRWCEASKLNPEVVRSFLNTEFNYPTLE